MAKASSESGVPKPAPRIPTEAWAGVLLAGHPRLLGPKSHVQALARAKPQEYHGVRTHDSLWATGMVRAVEGVPRERLEPFIRKAKENVARGVTNFHQDTWIWMNEVALAYDFFHDEIPPQERRAWIEWLNAHLEAYTDDENAFHNSTLTKILIYLRIAYATCGENPRAKDFRDYALGKLWEKRILPVIRRFGAGGGFTECGWYSRGSLWNLVEAMELARRVEPCDGFQMAPTFFYHRMAYEMLQPYPVRGELGNELYACEGDGSYKYGMSREGPRLMRTVLAQYWRGSPLARYMAARRRPGTSPEVRTMDFLWEEPPDEPLDPGSFPLSHCAKGIGRVYARSDWTADATWFRFECGDFWCNHQHYEVGNFEIFCREPLATESGEYYFWGSNHEINYLIRTIAHNCLLVYQPGEAWTQMRDLGKNLTANDGGQINKWGWISQTLDEWLRKRDLYHRGDLVAYDNRPEFLFVAGDCTPAYAETKLALWIRQIVFLRPGTFVLFDRVEGTRPQYDKTWLLHMAGEPAIDGDEVIITRGPSRLVSRTLLPEKAIIRKVRGYTYRGQTFEAEPSSQSDVAPKWRIEVLPPEPRTDELFLHVMFTGEPKPVELVRQGDAVGARVGDAEVLFKGKVGGSLGLGGRRMRLKAGLKLGKYET